MRDLRPDEIEYWHERSAIREHDGGQSREDAERDAMEDVLAMRKNSPEQIERTDEMNKSKTIWEVLSRIDVSQHIEKKNGFSYLSWAWAWSTLKDHYPHAVVVKHMNAATSLPFFSDPATRNAYVQVSIQIDDTVQTEIFPVLDYANHPIENPNAFQVNTAIQRCMAKAIAMLGLGAYIYAGEDLPPSPKVVEIDGGDAREKTEVTGLDMIVTTLKNFLPMQTTPTSLEDYWRNNSIPIGIVQRENPARYAELVNAFKARKAEVSNMMGKV